MLKLKPLIVLMTIGFTACGGSRQAAWERDGGAKELGDGESVDALTATANESWANRSDKAGVEKAIATWEKLADANPGNFEVLTMLARGYYFLGDCHLRFTGENDKMKSMFEKGVTMGERAMLASSKAFEDRVKAGEKVEEAVGSIPKEGQPSIYWYAVNLGKWASLDGFSTLLRFKSRIYSVMEQVLALDDTYFYGAPHRYFGAYYAKAPGFAGGDMGKSREHFEKAIELAPNYAGAKVAFADYWAVKDEDEELFDQMMADVQAIDASADPAIVPEQTCEKKKAEALAATKNDIF